MFSFLFIFLLNPVFAFENQEILGHWKFTEMIYRGERVPLVNPELNLNWTFFKNGTERLYWDRGTDDFCERFASFSIKKGILSTETFSVNPQNAADCSKDPDMQVGKKTQIKFEILKNEVHFHLPLGDEDLIYVFKPLKF